MPVNMSWEISESWAGIISLRPNNRHDKSDRLNDKIYRKTNVKFNTKQSILGSVSLTKYVLCTVQRAERNMRKRGLRVLT